jgi:hypothetical protein
LTGIVVAQIIVTPSDLRSKLEWLNNSVKKLHEDRDEVDDYFMDFTVALDLRPLHKEEDDEEWTELRSYRLDSLETKLGLEYTRHAPKWTHEKVKK